MKVVVMVIKDWKSMKRWSDCVDSRGIETVFITFRSSWNFLIFFHSDLGQSPASECLLFITSGVSTTRR